MGLSSSRLAGLSANTIGILCAIGAALFFSMNDAVIKSLSSSYALHQIILIRASIGLLILLVLLLFSEQKFKLLKTRYLPKHLMRGACVVFANMLFFLALASMPLADAVAIFFISPVIITLFSIIFLGEKVGLHRWLATLLGFVGVMIIVRPGSASFQLVSLLPIASAICYATLHILTRSMRGTESAGTMIFYIQVTFIIVSVLMGLTLGDGRYAPADIPSLYFLLRPWAELQIQHWDTFMIVGVASAAGGYLISQAYRQAEAGLAAPFEYIALPMSIFWGITLFNEWPSQIDLLGMGLILVSGLYTIWRETLLGKRLSITKPRRR